MECFLDCWPSFDFSLGDNLKEITIQCLFDLVGPSIIFLVGFEREVRLQACYWIVISQMGKGMRKELFVAMDRAALQEGFFLSRVAKSKLFERKEQQGSLARCSSASNGVSRGALKAVLVQEAGHLLRCFAIAKSAIVLCEREFATVESLMRIENDNLLVSWQLGHHLLQFLLFEINEVHAVKICQRLNGPRDRKSVV